MEENNGIPVVIIQYKEPKTGEYHLAITPIAKREEWQTDLLLAGKDEVSEIMGLDWGLKYVGSEPVEKTERPVVEKQEKKIKPEENLDEDLDIILKSVMSEDLECEEIIEDIFKNMI